MITNPSETTVFCSLCVERPATGETLLPGVPGMVPICETCLNRLDAGDTVEDLTPATHNNNMSGGGESQMDFRSLGGILLLVGLVVLVIGYVVPVAVLVSLGWVGILVGLVLVIVAAVTGGRRSRL